MACWVPFNSKKSVVEKTWNFAWLDVDSSLQTNDSKWLDSSYDLTLTRLSHDSYSTRKNFRWLWLDSDSKSLWLWLNKNDLDTPLMQRHDKAYVASCLWGRDERTVKFFSRVQSWSDKIESDAVLIPKIFENHQSNPVLIRQGKIMYFYFASWGKRTTGAILPLAKYDWLKAK